MPGKEYDATPAVQMTEIDGTARSVIAHGRCKAGLMPARPASAYPGYSGPAASRIMPAFGVLAEERLGLFGGAVEVF